MSVDVFVTDYGEVLLSPNAVDYLMEISPDWRALSQRKARFYKNPELEAKRRKVQDFCTTVRVMAALRWRQGGEVLKEL